MSYGVCQYNKGQANGWPYWQLHPIYRVLSGAKAPREIVLGGSRQQKGQNAMRYLSAVCFLAIVAFADASPAAAQQNCACFCRVQGEGGGGCWVDVPGCNPRSGVRACNDGAMCGYNCGTPGLPARRSAPRAHPLGQHYRPTEQPR